MFAYCNNNPINFTDHAGNWPDLSALFEAVAITALAVAAVAAVVAATAVVATAVAVAGGPIITTVATTATIVGTQALAVSTTAALASLACDKVEKQRTSSYSVYFLEDDEGTIQYVGRVTDSGYRARMAWHYKTRGLTPAYRVSGLSYEEARGLEEVGIAQCHTLNAANPKNNQIHGISQTNKNADRYIEAAYNYLCNKAESWLLDIFS